MLENVQIVNAIIEDSNIKNTGSEIELGHQLYAVAFKQGKGSLEFRLPIK